MYEAGPDKMTPVHGQWGQWSEWDDSSFMVPGFRCALDSSRKRTRKRYCDNPKPKLGGRSCKVGWDLYDIVGELRGSRTEKQNQKATKKGEIIKRREEKRR